MFATAPASSGRWRARPTLARMCRGGALLGPVLVVVVTAYLGALLLPAGSDLVTIAGWWTAVATVAVVGAIASERLLRKLLTIASILDLDIGFPSAVPTRWQIASQALRSRGRAQPDAVPPDDLDAAAEEVMVWYAAGARAGLQPRSHLKRVRGLAVLVAARLGLEQSDRDRLQWALLLRELGTTWHDDRGPAYPLTAWLGPWTELLHGPFSNTAAYAQLDALAVAAHVTAVADAYVVVSAAHPYQRSLGSRHAGATLVALAQRHLQREAVDALLTLPESRLRRATGFTAGISPLLARFAPAPQPTFALASVLVVALLAASLGAPPDNEADKAGTDLAQLNVEPPSTPQPQAATAATPSPSARQADGSDNKTVKKREQPLDVVAPRVPARTVTYASAESQSADDPPSASAGAASPRPTATPTPKPSPSPKPTPAPSPTPTPKLTPTPTPEPTPTPTPTPSPKPGGDDAP